MPSSGNGKPTLRESIGRAEGLRLESINSLTTMIYFVPTKTSQKIVGIVDRAFSSA